MRWRHFSMSSESRYIFFLFFIRNGWHLLWFFHQEWMAFVMIFSSRMDGLHCDFYKAMLDTIQDYFYCLTTDEFSSRRLSNSLNQGHSKLITKNVATSTIRAWRLTNFIIVSYKIMVEAMALQIHSIAWEVVQ